MKTGLRRSGVFGLVVLMLLTALGSGRGWCQSATPQGDSGQVKDLQAKLEQTQKDLARSERDLRTYLFPAYLIVWLALFGYVRSLDRRQRALEERLTDLQARVEARGEGPR